MTHIGAQDEIIADFFAYVDIVRSEKNVSSDKKDFQNEWVKIKEVGNEVKNDRQEWDCKKRLYSGPGL